MEVYILDSLLRREQVVDKFESFIWTERYDDIGDFEILLHSTREARGQFRTGVHLAINTSYRVMTVETVEDVADEGGQALLRVKGRSLEAILEDRVSRITTASLEIEPEWLLEGTPGDVARTIFQAVCVQGALHVGDIIPFMMPGTIFPASSIPEPDSIISAKIPPESVSESVQTLCKTYDLGYRLVRNFDTSQLYFDIYSGNDRTTRQTTYSSVIFAAEHDNMKNSIEYSSIEKSKNVAYVFSDFGFEIVYADFLDPSVDGFDRRVLVLNVSDIDPLVEDPQGVMQQRGKEALYNSRAFSIFDGQIDQYSPYKYGTHYELGDMVEVRNVDGEITYKRITEQIFIADSEGERSYPTLSIHDFVNANTWLMQKTDRVWEDFGETEYWLDQ